MWHQYQYVPSPYERFGHPKLLCYVMLCYVRQFMYKANENECINESICKKK